MYVKRNGGVLMKRNKLVILMFVMLIAAAATYIIWDGIESAEIYADSDRKTRIDTLSDDEDYRLIDIESEADAREVISIYADNNGYSTDDYPDDFARRLAAQPEMRDFILEYPEHINEDREVSLSEISVGDDLEKTTGVPLFLQWDKRWGYRTYGSNLMAFTGCGPTCLSMVASYLLDNSYLTPAYVAQFSMDNGYYDYENHSGTFWTLMYQGAADLGLSWEDVYCEEWSVAEHLQNGEPIICIMGPGDFTSEGHFIVLTGYEDGYVTVNDPNSRERSSQRWELSQIMPQIQGMWAYSV